MLIIDGEIFFFNFAPITAIFALFFKILSVFGAKWLQKHTLSAPFKLFSTRNFTENSIGPGIEHYPTQYWSHKVTFLTNFQINFKSHEITFSINTSVFLTSVFHQFSRFHFQSFISLIRLEKGFRKFKKFAEVHKNITSLCQPRDTKFWKNLTSFRQGNLKKAMPVL